MACVIVMGVSECAKRLTVRQKTVEMAIALNMVAGKRATYLIAVNEHVVGAFAPSTVTFGTSHDDLMTKLRKLLN
jgi:hypothetical protein